MAEKYRLKINPPPPTDEEIAARKNFDRVLGQYRRTAKSRSLHDTISRLNKSVPVFILMLLLALLIVYFGQVMRRRNQPAPKPAPTQTGLNPATARGAAPDQLPLSLAVA
ncbi:MAG: hypothetical protein MUC97_17020 [Bernardetiaceae bacterium]|nr:hypothetical protein [Bernardetiaceae bacterium]